MRSREESFELCTGLFNITVTPFSADGTIDFEAMGANIERVLGIGYDGLLIGGTYGEFPSMSAQERAELFRAVMRVVGDRVPVLLCTASSDVRVVRELTFLASDLGGLPMVTAPYVSEITDDQIVHFFSTIAPLSSTGLMIYNAPGIGITLSTRLLQRLSEVPGIVALKQGDLALSVVDTLVGSLSGRIRLLVASDLAMPAPLVLGFDGVSSTNSCAMPELIHAEYHALRDGGSPQAERLHRIWYPIRECARKYGQPQTVKAAMNLRGFGGGRVRAPLLDLGEAECAEVRQALQSIARDPASCVMDLPGVAGKRA